MYFCKKKKNLEVSHTTTVVAENECFAELDELASLVTLRAVSGCACSLDYTYSCEAAHSYPTFDFIKAL